MKGLQVGQRLLPTAFRQVFLDELSARGQRLLLRQMLQQSFLGLALLLVQHQAPINLDLCLQELFVAGMFGNQFLDQRLGGQKLARLDIEIEQLQLDLLGVGFQFPGLDQMLLGLDRLSS